MSLKIIAGPCSVNVNNVNELHEIASLNTQTRKVIYGLRVVGLKSRTEFKNSSDYVGIDFDIYLKLLNDLINGVFSLKSDMIYPSVEIAKEIVATHSCLKIASEIIDPVLQIPVFAEHLGNNFIPWNPAVMQLGWQLCVIGEYAKKYNLTIGIKNGKNLGCSIVDSELHNKTAPMEKVWKGLATYTSIQNYSDRIIMIHRGIDDYLKGEYRNFPVHKCAERVKKSTNYQMFFDPSHSCGPKLRDKIVDITVEAMNMKINDGQYLYDGILIETGTSTTDTEQHITIDELSDLIDRVSKFRVI